VLVTKYIQVLDGYVSGQVIVFEGFNHFNDRNCARRQLLLKK
jgi:hypothetical protein